MTRLRGWAPKGERLVDKVPQGKWKTATFLAALRNDRIEAPCLFDGPINGERFHAYVEQFLAPTLKPGDVVILDNFGSHKGKAVRRAIRDIGARLVFLPKYSPDLNPIEQVFAKFKTLPRKVGRAKLRSRLPSLCSDSHPVSPRRMRRIHQERRLCVKPNAGGSRSRAQPRAEPPGRDAPNPRELMMVRRIVGQPRQPTQAVSDMMNFKKTKAFVIVKQRDLPVFRLTFLSTLHGVHEMVL